MKSQNELLNTLKELKVLPLFYHDDFNICKGVVDALYKGGIRCIEFTHRGANASVNFKKLLEYRNASLPDLLLAIGTVKNVEDASMYIELGADFLISPFYDQSIADICYLHKKLWVPGCMTPTEIHIAEAGGCSLIKLFPRNTLGPGYVAAIKPLFPNLNFIVTGGVDTSESNIKSWFEAGVIGVGMGSKLITNSILDTANFDVLEIESKKLLTITASLKN